MWLQHNCILTIYRDGEMPEKVDNLQGARPNVEVYDVWGQDWAQQLLQPEILQGPRTHTHKPAIYSKDFETTKLSSKFFIGKHTDI